jgi:hypothetical protein
VATAAHGESQVILARKIDGGDDVSHTRARDNEQRAFVDHGVPYAARAIVCSVGRRDDFSAKAGTERFD